MSDQSTEQRMEAGDETALISAPDPSSAATAEHASPAAAAEECPPLSALIGKGLTASQRAALVVAMYWQPKPKKRRRQAPQRLRGRTP
jgi:hypothetical protein